jgi:hypothetical protein
MYKGIQKEVQEDYLLLLNTVINNLTGGELLCSLLLISLPALHFI